MELEKGELRLNLVSLRVPSYDLCALFSFSFSSFRNWPFLSFLANRTMSNVQATICFSLPLLLDNLRPPSSFFPLLLSPSPRAPAHNAGPGDGIKIKFCSLSRLYFRRAKSGRPQRCRSLAVRLEDGYHRLSLHLASVGRACAYVWAWRQPLQVCRL